MLRPFACLALITALAGAASAQERTDASPWTERVKPFKVMANIYYVGTLDLSSFLVTSSDGHILIDTGVEKNGDAIIESIKALGFNVRDVKVILTTQAHYDHVAAHALLQQASGARVLASAADAPLMEAGGEGDYLFGAAHRFPAVKVDALVRDGETVRVGSSVLTARLTPGHTKGDTTWTMTVKDAGGQDRQVVFLGSTSVNPGTVLVDNVKYPEIAADYQRAFAVQKALKCEVFLAAHGSAFRGPEKAVAAAGGQGDAAFVDPGGCRAAIERSERAFLTELGKQGGK